MTTSLFVAPAASGKTGYLIALVREATHDLSASARICVANRQQLASWQRRLAANGGCIGAELMTFDQLYLNCLAAAGETYSQIEDILEYRLLRTIIADIAPTYYQPVQSYPGFIQEIQRIIGEMKSAQISPRAFLQAVKEMGNAARLREVGEIYAAYQRYLKQNEIADFRGLGWLALDAITERAPQVGADWSHLILDGFASFTQVQLSLLKALQPRVGQMVITMSGDLQAGDPRPCHRHFLRARQALEETLGVKAQPLPSSQPASQNIFTGLESNLFLGQPVAPPEPSETSGDPPVQMAKVADHVAEVRLALRWLKQKLVENNLAPHETSLVARDISLYRPFILLAAEEFDLPIHFVEGIPLRKNPCINAIITLMQMLLPASPGAKRYSPALPRRALIASLRSPYFDWQQLAATADGASDLLLEAADIDALDIAGRWGQVISGDTQWWETFERLAAVAPAALEDGYDDRGKAPPNLPIGDAARTLRQKLDFILARLQPPQGNAPYSAFIKWLETLIGPDEQAGTPAAGTLNLLARLHEAQPVLRNRDIAAIRSFKGILRSLYWTEIAQLSDADCDYAQFIDELLGAIDAASYQPGAERHHDAILVSSVVQARGVPCRALAVLGLAEGLFPAPLREEPFLREGDRERLRAEFALPFESTIDSHEQEYFYETITRCRDWLLLTRPAQAESGTEWEPSPFWSEVARITGVGEADGALVCAAPASTHELLFTLSAAVAPLAEALGGYPTLATQWEAVKLSAQLFNARWNRQTSPHNGYLQQIAARLSPRFDNRYVWSPSRLENYLSCPHHFFLSHVLGVEARPEPAEGLNARQLGNIYHRLFEATYAELPREQQTSAEQLQSAFEAVAGGILEDAPWREGFRETAWWSETQREIRTHVQRSLEKLAEERDGYVPTHFELFFAKGQELSLRRSGDEILVQGVIDRIDVNAQGRLRLIDYKTAGPSNYTKAAHRDGKLLQLPLYALAAQEALKLGEVEDGFYWHVQHAKASSFNLADAGPEAAIATAVEHAWNAVAGVRDGQFAPTPPDGGCPSYCPGAAFCWMYQPRFEY